MRRSATAATRGRAMAALILAVMTGTTAFVAGPVTSVRATGPATYTVTTAEDLPGSTCDAVCSLRQAIGAANANAGALDMIVFALAGGPADITVTTALPAITDPVTIDGTTQPGIRLVGTALTGSEDGLVVQASGSVIRGLEIREFPGRGILLDGVHDTVVGGDTAAEGNVITANGLDGVTVIGDATAVNNRITANRIFGNGSLSIDLGDDDSLSVGGDINDGDMGPNGYQNGPVLVPVRDTVADPVLQVNVSTSSRADVSTARVDMFRSPSCPFTPDLSGQIPQAFEHLGSIELALTTTPSGRVGTGTFNLPAPLSSGYLTATTTTVDGTSELSYCEFIKTRTDLAVTGTATPAGPTDVGEPVTFNVTVSNLGPVRHDDVAVEVLIDGQFGPSYDYGSFESFTGAEGGCVEVGGFPYEGAGCFIGGIDPGQSVALTATFIQTVAGPWSALLLLPFNTDADPDYTNNELEIERVSVAAESASELITTPGGSLSTDTEGDGATPADPIETTVTLPPGATGTVTIAEGPDPDATPPPVGYGFVGQAVAITIASTATAANPYVFTFTVDESLAPTSPIVFRNGVPVMDCTTPADPAAAPDPCVVVVPPVQSGDDTVITVRTSAASTWRVGYVLPYDFEGFFAPVDNGLTLNRVKAGSAVPVRFSLGGDRGLDVFADGNPRSFGIACGTARVDALEETVTAGSSSLSYAADTDRYAYVWKTNKAWAGTCRKLQITFSDGTTREALFDFRR